MDPKGALNEDRGPQPHCSMFGLQMPLDSLLDHLDVSKELFVLPVPLPLHVDPTEKTFLVLKPEYEVRPAEAEAAAPMVLQLSDLNHAEAIGTGGELNCVEVRLCCLKLRCDRHWKEPRRSMLLGRTVCVHAELLLSHRFEQGNAGRVV